MTSLLIITMFQFPTNGKAYPKREVLMNFLKGLMLLFQFPTNGKAYPKLSDAEQTFFPTLEFQFPTNGKAYPKRKRKRRLIVGRLKVSIPYERESLSKAWQCLPSVPTYQVSIPYERESLSKVFSKLEEVRMVVKKFQFPTNGKAYPKEKNDLDHLDCRYCFNSLRTGKPIQREN